EPVVFLAIDGAAPRPGGSGGGGRFGSGRRARGGVVRGHLVGKQRGGADRKAGRCRAADERAAADPTVPKSVDEAAATLRRHDLSLGDAHVSHRIGAYCGSCVVREFPMIGAWYRTAFRHVSQYWIGKVSRTCGSLVGKVTRWTVTLQAVDRADAQEDV